MKHASCEQNYTDLDLREFRFCLVSQIPLDASIRGHLQTCPSCVERLAALAPSEEQEMRQFFAEFAEWLKPATAKEHEDTSARLRQVLQDVDRRSPRRALSGDLTFRQR